MPSWFCSRVSVWVPLWKPQKGLFGKATPEGWILIAPGSCALLMCHLIRSRRLSSQAGKWLNLGPLWLSCRHICGRCGVPLRTTGTRCYVWHVCQLCICATLASFLYLIPPFLPPELSLLLSLQATGFAPYRTVCLTEVSQKVSSCFSLQILLIILILFLLGGGWVTGCPW